MNNFIKSEKGMKNLSRRLRYDGGEINKVIRRKNRRRRVFVDN